MAVCFFSSAPPSTAGDLVATQHRYTPLELADMSRAQLVELVLALQQQPPEVRGEVQSAAAVIPPKQVHRRATGLMVVGATVGGALLMTALRSHPSLGTSSPAMGLASARRSTLAATTTCNPATTLGCGVNITSASCSTVQAAGGLVSAGLTAYAAQNPSGHTQPIGQVSTSNSTPLTINGTTTNVPTATFIAQPLQQGQQTATVSTAQSGAATTGTIWTSVANFGFSTVSLWMGCNNQVTSNGTSSVSTTTSSVRR